jgi:hypothetical protein
MLLHSSKDWIFDDESGTWEEMFGLTEKLFDKLNKHLTNNKRTSICIMTKAIDKRKILDTHYKVLKGKSERGWSTEHIALQKWFQKQKITVGLYDRIDKVYNNLGVALILLINEELDEGEEFLNILDSECTKEDILLIIASDHAKGLTIQLVRLNNVGSDCLATMSKDSI